jgi:predicted phosphodiesterase
LRYLLLSDIHSNLEGLEACLEAGHEKYEEALCLGDLVGYGPDPNAVVEKMRVLAKVIIRGNHDKACAGLDDASDFNPLARWATLWTREALAPDNLEFLRSLPQGPVTLDGFDIVHGSPLDEDEYITGPDQAIPVIRTLQRQIICYGHTHHQGGFMLTPKGRFLPIRLACKENGLIFSLPLEKGGRYLLNPGSVGQPRDGDPRAAFAILDTEVNQLEYYRAPYNIHQTQEKMQKHGLPEPLIRRLEFGR